MSIELDMFHPDDAKALHDAGFSIRVNLPRSEALAAYRQGGRDIVSAVVQWIAGGLIDTVSGDDVPFLARLVEHAGMAGSRYEPSLAQNLKQIPLMLPLLRGLIPLIGRFNSAVPSRSGIAAGPVIFQ